MTEVFLALGANLGDRSANLERARAALEHGILANVSASSIYETEPWGPVPQGRYLNQVLRGTTELTPRELLMRLQEIERSLGRNREREERYGARVIDLDILIYGGLKIAEPGLEIPHPRMMQRAFVLAPLAELAPDLAVNGISVRAALEGLDRSGVARYRA